MQNQQGLFTYQAVMMGSPIIIKMPHHNEALIRDVFRLIKSYEQRFTVNQPDSQVMEVNRYAGLQAVNVDQSVFYLIQQAKAVSMLPNSAFNIAIGPLVKLWKIGFNGHTPPTEQAIQQILPLILPHNILLNESNHSIFLAEPGMEIDLGAVAKGYIADKVKKFLLSRGIQHALINLGGNIHSLSPNLLSASSPTSSAVSDNTEGALSSGWRIGLKKPFAEKDAYIGTFRITNQSVGTSGIYERYFQYQGKLFHHILDRHTGYPIENNLQSVTVISESSLEGEYWSTRLFGAGLVEGMKMLETEQNIQAIFITKDNRVYLSHFYSNSHSLQDSHANNLEFTLFDQDYELAQTD